MKSDLALVSVFREEFDETPWFGFIVGESDDFLALHAVSDRYDLDGYRVFRNDHLSEVDEDFEQQALVRKALELKGLEPVALAWLALDSMRALVASVQENESLVVFEREHVDPDECEIGRIRLDSEASYSLVWMTPAAQWELDDRVFHYDDVTQVSFGGEYERTLALVAGPPPAAGAA